MSTKKVTSAAGQPTKPEITVFKLEHSARMSEETLCFTAVVLVDGQKVIEASNRGEGGATSLNPYVNRNKAYLSKAKDKQMAIVHEARNTFNEVMARLKAYADTLPLKQITCGEQSYELKQDVETLVMDAVYKELARKDLARLTKRSVVIVHNEEAVELRLKASDYNTDKKDKYREEILRKWPGAVILNDMEEAKALELFQKATNK